MIRMIGLLAVLWAGAAVADAPPVRFDPDIHHRIRFELDGARDLTDGELVERVGQVLRLGATFSWKDRIRVVGRFQDVRLWGSEQDTLTDFSGDTLDLHEGYVSVDALLEPFRLTLEGGRMTWSYDDQRIIGKVGWTLQERRFDGARLRLTSGRWSADLFYAKIAEADAGVAPDRDFFGAHASLELGSVRTALLATGDLSDERSRFTGGFFVRGTPGLLRYRLEAYVQATPDDDDATDDVGLFAGGEVGVHLDPEALRFSATLGADFVSGRGDGLAAFDTLFATNHAFYGYMDFFIALPAHTGGAGLVDAWLRAGLQPAEPLTVLLAYHHFRQATGGEAFGNEIDLVITWRPFPPWVLQVGGGVILPEAPLGAVRGGTDTEGWFYVMSDIRL